MKAFSATVILSALVGCASCSPEFRECPAIEASLLEALPERLSETGLFADMASETLGEGVVPFTPRFPLWSDGATKRRWIQLPPGTAIDTSDPNAWRFPVGTKLFKEFRRDGIRVETRLLLRHGTKPGDWTPLAYLWDGDDAVAVPEGRVDALGTPHDVPSAADCMGCHGGSESGVLGFSAVQLPERGEGDSIGLRDLRERGWITAPLPEATIPGDATTREALGYLHANCSHCHNQRRPAREGPRCFDPERAIDLSLRVGELDAPEHTGTFRTAVGRVIRPGRPDESELMRRVRSRNPWWGMPALGSEAIDDEGVRLLEAFISGL